MEAGDFDMRHRRFVPIGDRRPHRRGLYREWAGIVALLEREIEGVAAALTTPGPGASGLEIKAYEDTLDAVVCAWVAVCAVEGLAVAFEDESAAIWIPSSEGGGLASGFRLC
jgi:hypothetical protein